MHAGLQSKPKPAARGQEMRVARAEADAPVAQPAAPNSSGSGAHIASPRETIADYARS
jgi:hypothetical protein